MVVPPGRTARRGAAASELAVLAPLLFTFAIGMCELGRLTMVKTTMANAARKGCRTGVTVGKGYQDIINDVKNILTDNGISTTNATITIQTASYSGSGTTPSWGSFTTITSSSSYTPSALDKVSVEISVPASDVLWFSPHFMTSSTNVSETLVMLRQG
jgi:Flp pilus assembly protein TadG